MPKTTLAAIDLGATSGRVIVGQWSSEGLELTEVHRFPNTFSLLNGNCYWDVGGMYAQIAKGLQEAKRLFPELAACGVDTWGVDHVLTDKAGRLAFPVHAYRDQRTDRILQRIRQQQDERKLFDLTGQTLLPFNTGPQLAETLEAFPGIRAVVDRVLLLPEYFNFLLSGRTGCEFSDASTTQLLDVNGRGWSAGALEYFKIPPHWLEPPVAAGSLLGPVREIAGLETVQVALVPGHDTSCAFEAIPQSGNSLILSSGTWMLVGALTEEPCTGDAAFRMGVQNERTGSGGYRPTKNVVGLWLIEQIIPAFEKRPGSNAEWSALISAASERDLPEVLIDTADPGLFNPRDMRAAIDQQVTSGGGRPPADLPGYIQLICASLGAGVRDTARSMEAILGRDFDNIVIVGGGSKNSLLCQMIATFSGKSLTSFNLEATSVGNLAYQLLALGEIDSLSQFHERIRPSLAARTYQPE